MKRNLYIIGALAATLAFASCQQNDLDSAFNADPNAVRIDASVGNSSPFQEGQGGCITRTNPTGDAAAQKTFNPGDAISVSAGTQGAVKYTLANGVWTPEANKYLKWYTSTMNFTAYYPVGGNTDLTDDGHGAILTTDAQNFALPYDQYTKEKIAAADYMTAVDEPITKGTGGAATLQLKRRTARIIVRIDDFADQYTDDQLYVKNLKILIYAAAYKGGNVVMSTESLLLRPYYGNENHVANKGEGKGSTFTALILPHEARPDDYFISLADGSSNLLYVRGVPKHEAGMSYTYNIKVGKNGLTVGSVTVKDWGNEAVIPGGEATEVPFGDPEFVKVLTASPHNVPNTNGKIDPTDATTKEALENITDLNVYSKGIKSLKGIEYLTGLTALECSSNSLSTLDVSQNKRLTALSCCVNSLANLDVSQNKALIHLYCYSNSLTTLDLSQNTKLTELKCNNNRLANLNLSQNTGLIALYCNNNRLSTLNITALTNDLIAFYCGNQEADNGADGRMNLILTEKQKATIGKFDSIGANVTLVTQ